MAHDQVHVHLDDEQGFVLLRITGDLTAGVGQAIADLATTRCPLETVIVDFSDSHVTSEVVPLVKSLRASHDDRFAIVTGSRGLGAVIDSSGFGNYVMHAETIENARSLLT